MLFAEPAESLETLARRPLEPSGGHRDRPDPEPTMVTIGRPRWAPVDGATADEDFFVLQLACSFLPSPTTHVEWARFQVGLRSADAGAPAPIAVDLSPMEIQEEQQAELSVLVEPALRFGTVADLTLGSVGTKVQTVRHIPVTVAAGLNESVIYWQMERTAGHPVVGSRGFYALLAQRRPAHAVVVTARLVADIKTEGGGLFRAAIREHRDVPPLEHRLEVS